MTSNSRITKKLSVPSNISFPQRHLIFEYDSPENLEELHTKLTTQHFTNTERYRNICESFSKFSETNNETLSTSVDSKNIKIKRQDKICKDKNWFKKILCWKHTNDEGTGFILVRSMRGGSEIESCSDSKFFRFYVP